MKLLILIIVTLLINAIVLPIVTNNIKADCTTIRDKVELIQYEDEMRCVDIAEKSIYVGINDEFKTETYYRIEFVDKQSRVNTFNLNIFNPLVKKEKIPVELETDDTFTMYTIKVCIPETPDSDENRYETYQLEYFDVNEEALYREKISQTVDEIIKEYTDNKLTNVYTLAIIISIVFIGTLYVSLSEEGY